MDGTQSPILFYMFYSYFNLRTLIASLPSRLTLISPNLTSSATALALVFRYIPVTSSDNTISPPTCSRLNASVRIMRAKRYVLALVDFLSASTHFTGSFTHRDLNGTRLPFLLLFAAG